MNRSLYILRKALEFKGFELTEGLYMMNFRIAGEEIEVRIDENFKEIELMRNDVLDKRLTGEEEIALFLWNFLYDEIPEEEEE